MAYSNLLNLSEDQFWKNSVILIESIQRCYVNQISVKYFNIEGLLTHLVRLDDDFIAKNNFINLFVLCACFKWFAKLFYLLSLAIFQPFNVNESRTIKKYSRNYKTLLKMWLVRKYGASYSKKDQVKFVEDSL